MRPPSLAAALLLALTCVGLVLASSGCEDTAGPDAGSDPGPSGADGGDGGQDDSPPGDGGADGGGTPLAVAAYCEALSPFFCDFYLRCGRTVATTREGCEADFLEACNARFEPRYGQLADAGLLRLSADGVEACRDHLGTVFCDAQPLDLLGPCAGMWEGLQPAGEPCGLDLESLVCAAGSHCRLSLDFCGTCTPHLPLGAACSDGGVCAPDAQCVEGQCLARVPPGGPCGPGRRCIAGVDCVGGVCEAPAWVGVGESCSQARRCVQPAVCQGGLCRDTARLGEPCSADRPCASGRCVPDGSGTRCAPYLQLGEACAAPSDCGSGRCAEGLCAPLPGACIPADG